MKQLYEEQIGTAMAALKKKTIGHVYLTACGGSQAVLAAGQHLSDEELTVPCCVYTTNEFNYAIPRGLSENSLVITCSCSGTTPETVEATEKAREPRVITICSFDGEGFPLWEAVKYPVHYDQDKDVDASDLSKGILYGLLLNISLVLSGSKKQEICLNEFDKLNSLAIIEKNKFETTAKEWGKNQKRSRVTYTIGSGIDYGEAYPAATCWFMEMRWINFNVIRSGEFFHSPFEVTDYDVSFILAKSIGGTRLLDQRVEDFTKGFSNKLMVLDQADLDLESIDNVAKEYITTVLSGVVIRQIVGAIAFEKNHSSGIRRYMRQMEY